MENKRKKEELKIVSRPSNEEIQEDEVGNYQSGEELLEHKENNVATDGPFSEDSPKGKNSLDTTVQTKK